MAIGNLTVYCIKCNAPNIVNIDSFNKGQFLTCESCGNRFNYYGLVHWFYESISFAKEMVDIIVSHIYEGYSIKNSKEDIQKITEFFENNDFSSLLNEIVFDTVLYGTSFVEKIKIGEQLKLNRLNPTMVEAVTEFRQTPPATAYTQELEKVIVYDTSGSVEREIHYPNIVLFMGQPPLSGPLGVSVYGFWLHSWFFLKFEPRALRDLGMLDRTMEAKDFEKIKEYEENQVITASGIPLHYLIKPEDQMAVQLKAQQEQLFSYIIKERRERIASTIESEIFPIALGRDYEFETFPRFILKK